MASVEWGEYRIGDLFESSNGDFDIQKNHINNRGDYVITSGLTNNGVLGKTDIKAKIFNKGTITIDMFGCAFYRNYDYKMVTHARVFSLKPNIDISENQGVFLSISLQYLKNHFGYENMCSWARIKDMIIKLPTKNSEIDFEFMESFVAELEAQRVAELEAYLIASGLDDYELTLDEENALAKLTELDWQEKYVTEIFDIKNTRNILSCEIVPDSGTTPYLCASADNNSVSSYISYKEQLLDKGNCIFIGGKTFVVSYQEFDFFSNDSHNLALYLKDEDKANKINQLYLATCVRKGLAHKYSWGNSISNKKIQTDKMMVPIKNDRIDYDVMNNLISAIQKLVIKDVVDYIDNKIEKTKQVVNSK